MQDDSDVGFIKTIAVGTLPCELVVAGFADEYAEYLKLYEGSEQPVGSVFSMLLGIAALLMILVGGLTIIFGPDTITYSVRTGPTFIQLIEMYPGPIVSVGFLLLGVVRWIEGESCEGPLTPEMFLMASYDLQLPEGLDPEVAISILHIDGALFHVSHS